MSLRSVIDALARVVYIGRHILAAGLGAIGGVVLGWLCMLAVMLMKLALKLPIPPPSENEVGHSPIFWGSVVFNTASAVFVFRKEKLDITFAEDCRRFVAWMRRDKPHQGELPFDR